ncbi:MAG: GDSL-type esterase/lipase family protein, partial [Roseibacillus sp.]|nr:GDSL-type esterase/lipase family protein [Roseibacillus sp.]
GFPAHLQSINNLTTASRIDSSLLISTHLPAHISADSNQSTNRRMNVSHKLTFAATSRIVLTTFAVLTITTTAMAEIAVKEGEKIAFLGDSITQAGARPNGYVRLAIQGLESAGVSTSAIPAGISGHKSNQMLARLERDVLSKKPDWMTLSCGGNDVWHRKLGGSLTDYKVNITKIVDQCQDAGVKVVILTSTMIGEDKDNPNNKKLAIYNGFLRELAKEKKCLLADLNTDMQSIIETSSDKKNGKLLTSDGVHMNPDGNKMMAVGVLRAFGLNAEQVKAAQAAW